MAETIKETAPLSFFGSDTKDAAVAVPALGSALALAWEAGSFQPIGGSAFGMFTITEHLVFALQALPLALLASLLAFMSHLLVKRQVPAGSRKTRWLFWLGLLTGCMIAGYVVTDHPALRSARVFPTMTAVMALMASSFIIFLWAPTSKAWSRHWPKPHPLSPRIKIAALAAFIEMFAFCLGFDQARLGMQLTVPASIVTSSETITGVIMRASTTGIVVYDRAADNFKYIRNDDIKQRTWEPRHATWKIRPATPPPSATSPPH